MTGAQNELLKRLETEVLLLTNLYQKIKKERDELNVKLENVEKNLSETQEIAKYWEKGHRNLKFAKIVSVDEQEAKEMRDGLSKLEREIEKCIALLNEYE